MSKKFPPLSFLAHNAIHDFSKPGYLEKKFGIELGDNSYCSLEECHLLSAEMSHHIKLLKKFLKKSSLSPDEMQVVVVNIQLFDGIRLAMDAQFAKRSLDDSAPSIGFIVKK